MACSPEQSKINGARSRGPRSAEGKAISSRNSRTHGLLATTPPLLATEDLATFQGVLQQLVDHYAPVGPVEWHLIQQIAMAIQKQHRVWSAEAIAGDQAVAAQALEAVYPEVDNSVSFGDKTAYHPAVLAAEVSILSDLYYDLQDNFEGCPTGSDRSAWVEWLTAGDDPDRTPYAGLVTMVERVNHALAVYPPAAWKERPFHPLLRLNGAVEDVLPDIDADDLVEVLQGLKKAVDNARAGVQSQLKKVTDVRSQLKTLKTQRDRGHALPESVQLLARYETHINRQLAKALEQLKKLQDDRLGQVEADGDLVGSFGKN